ncbi:MAG: sulfatase-like hydrolase/transferase [Alphaproteobacteria bacterium]|nr:sulfatase-like hydrolase/transferase [Alphaproteobacteria bacterium]
MAYFLSFVNIFYVYTDFIISSIIDMLRDKNAFLIYTSDHGESFGERGQTCLHYFILF